MKDPKPDVGAKAVDGDAPNKLPLDDEVAALANDPNPREPSAVETAPKALIGLAKTLLGSDVYEPPAEGRVVVVDSDDDITVTGGLLIDADSFVKAFMILENKALSVVVTEEGGEAGDPAETARKLLSTEVVRGVETAAIELIDGDPNKTPVVLGTVVETEPKILEARVSVGAALSAGTKTGLLPPKSAVVKKPPAPTLGEVKAVVALASMVSVGVAEDKAATEVGANAVLDEVIPALLVSDDRSREFNTLVELPTVPIIAPAELPVLLLPVEARFLKNGPPLRVGAEKEI